MTAANLPVLPSDCCAPAVQASCCEPGDKDACCGTEPAGGGCGCAAGQPAEPTGATPRPAS
jgi:hypothetical protein